MNVMSERPLVSIITPCYNHGQYLDEMLASIGEFITSEIFEIIIINDGSTDEFTLNKLSELESKGIKILHQQNQGLAKARNAGIAASSGKYILPLDSDNKIRPGVFIKASKILDNNPDISVVYTDAEYFGERTGAWHVGDLDISQILHMNYIDACALIRKSDLVESGGYDQNMPHMGNEDWELWLRFISQGKLFYYLSEAGFYYRVVSSSMSVTHTRPGYLENRIYVYKKHIKLFVQAFDLVYSNAGSHAKGKRNLAYKINTKVREMVRYFFAKKR